MRRCQDLQMPTEILALFMAVKPHGAARRLNFHLHRASRRKTVSFLTFLCSLPPFPYACLTLPSSLLTQLPPAYPIFSPLQAFFSFFFVFERIRAVREDPRRLPPIGGRCQLLLCAMRQRTRISVVSCGTPAVAVCSPPAAAGRALRQWGHRALR